MCMILHSIDINIVTIYFQLQTPFLQRSLQQNDLRLRTKRSRANRTLREGRVERSTQQQGRCCVGHSACDKYVQK